ncbi:thioredoxin family protein [Marinoscillum furvescens]|uniref:AhpC/TSA family protein n=1 Tax=Marinoscillum furvescens DSM 4134 TaxID=1122208 RepID=A0A3D9L3M5_MARFU|nr:thioredoxin family protein [Marinoscillum furvescens]RED99884.1 AhpC/TSA family protein [Marinoscillum furvescens DSM 4134]
MARTLSSMMPLGTKAPEFNLPDVVSGKELSLAEARGAKGLVVAFICAHCPYVLHVQHEMAAIASGFQDAGVDFVAISANDIEKYPDDRPEKMKEQAEQVGFNFPYLYDETQAVAKAYGAECTPDFFVFDENLECVYRGRMDEATPGNDKPVNGKDLRAALDALVAGDAISEQQFPSMGCNIKWK